MPPGINTDSAGKHAALQIQPPRGAGGRRMVMRDEYDRVAPLMQPVEQGKHLGRRFRVESGRGLVRQNDAGGA